MCYLFLFCSLFVYFRVEQQKLNNDKKIFNKNTNMITNDIVDSYIAAKQKIILCNFETIDDNGILFFGDSIVEQIYLPQISCLNVYNAGVGGARATASVKFLGAVLDRSLFRLMVLSIGTNDTLRKFSVAPEDFSTSYDAMVQVALDRKIPVILATIPPLEESQKLSQQFDPERIAAFNKRIMAIGRKHGLTVVDVNGLILEKTVERHDSFSRDGVHLNDTYSRFWRGAIYAAVRTALIDAKSLGQ
jgi:lysophospholipase L1-like esterase